MSECRVSDGALTCKEDTYCVNEYRKIKQGFEVRRRVLKINIILTDREEIKSSDYCEYLHTESTLAALCWQALTGQYDSMSHSATANHSAELSVNTGLKII